MQNVLPAAEIVRCRIRKKIILSCSLHRMEVTSNTHKYFSLVFKYYVFVRLVWNARKEDKSFYVGVWCVGGRREGFKRLNMVDLVLSLLLVISCKLLPPKYFEQKERGEPENWQVEESSYNNIQFWFHSRVWSNVGYVRVMLKLNNVRYT